MADQQNQLEVLLDKLDDAAWATLILDLQPAIHSVDQKATRIWFAFYPIKLHRALNKSADPDAIAKSLILKGKYRLADQVDSSAEFLYGHRYWPQVKAAVANQANTVSGAPLEAQIRDVARKVAGDVKADVSLLVGITAVAFCTLQQVGLAAFKQPAVSGRYGAQWKQSADQVVADRAKDDSQGVFGFLRSINKNFTVNYREYEPGCSFKLISGQDVTMAGRQYDRDYHAEDARCMPGEGPIPVECRAASCGTCWVGVLSDGHKLSPPNQREIDRWRYFGYEGFTGDADSPIRLACQMKALGNVSLVVSPWSGMIGKLDEKEKASTAGA
ncbi:MAG TPA: 2Fe-2S iron-sulfur cluster-binding protein [Blastocatellia bacterium]|nr:2Fe-2S iron-sulfur cluster-binding protein [Blastocatellia bacterium]